MKIVIDDKIPYVNGVFEPYGEVVYMPGADIGPVDVAGADALIIRTRTQCDKALLEGSRVRFIGTATIGFDHIDMEYCHANGIKVVTAAGSNAGGVLQWIGAALALLAGEGRWRPEEKYLGIVGVGHIGSLVERYGKMWGFRVLCSDPPREEREGLGRADGFVPLEEIARQADIITFHTPLTRDGDYPTCGLAGERFFRLIKDGTAIINAARGGIVNEACLKRAIRERGFAGLLDTWCNEPDIDRELLGVVAAGTQHIAGYSAQGKANASAMMVDATGRYFGIPVAGWYPRGVTPFPDRRPVSWEEMCTTIGDYCDLAAMTAALRAAPGDFEKLRGDYDYRQEYF